MHYMQINQYQIFVKKWMEIYNKIKKKEQYQVYIMNLKRQLKK